MLLSGTLRPSSSAIQLLLAVFVSTASRPYTCTISCVSCAAMFRNSLTTKLKVRRLKFRFIVLQQVINKFCGRNPEFSICGLKFRDTKFRLRIFRCRIAQTNIGIRQTFDCNTFHSWRRVTFFTSFNRIAEIDKKLEDCNIAFPASRCMHSPTNRNF